MARTVSGISSSMGADKKSPAPWEPASVVRAISAPLNTQLSPCGGGGSLGGSGGGSNGSGGGSGAGSGGGSGGGSVGGSGGGSVGGSGDGSGTGSGDASMQQRHTMCAPVQSWPTAAAGAPPCAPHHPLGVVPMTGMEMAALPPPSAYLQVRLLGAARLNPLRPRFIQAHRRAESLHTGCPGLTCVSVGWFVAAQGHHPAHAAAAAAAAAHVSGL
jgi:hypothetical protein